MSLVFHIEDRAGVPVIVWDIGPIGGTRAASGAEADLWNERTALRAAARALCERLRGVENAFYEDAAPDAPSLEPGAWADELAALEKLVGEEEK